MDCVSNSSNTERENNTICMYKNAKKECFASFKNIYKTYLSENNTKILNAALNMVERFLLDYMCENEGTRFEMMKSPAIIECSLKILKDREFQESFQRFDGFALIDLVDAYYERHLKTYGGMQQGFSRVVRECEDDSEQAIFMELCYIIGHEIRNINGYEPTK